MRVIPGKSIENQVFCGCFRIVKDHKKSVPIMGLTCWRQNCGKNMLKRGRKRSPLKRYNTNETT